MARSRSVTTRGGIEPWTTRSIEIQEPLTRNREGMGWYAGVQSALDIPLLACWLGREKRFWKGFKRSQKKRISPGHVIYMKWSE